MPRCRLSGVAWRVSPPPLFFFWAWALIGKIPLPRGKDLVGAILYGALGGFSFIFIYWGLVKTPASLYQTIVALSPILTLFFAFFHGLEPLRRWGVAGALLTVAGIAIAVGGSQSANISILHVLAIIAGAALMAESGVVVKLFTRTHLVATNAVAFSVSPFILGAASFLAGEKAVVPTLPTTWIAYAYIVIFVTILTGALFLLIVKRWTASGTSYSMVLIPLVTIVVANLLAKEQITLQFILGAAIVLFGVWFGALLPPKKRA
jgi:drug/metabolite transporter (DMT)-like permease